MSLALNIYRAISWSLTPLVRFYFQERLKKGKEDPLRAKERWGVPSLKRDMNRPLIWVHAVSVGESVSALPLLKILHEECRNTQLLLTTGTVGSAKVMAQRLPPYVSHQYAPLDLPQVMTRFLEAWDPDLAISVESELWPNMLTLTQERGILTLLLNGRLSEKSYNRWKFFPALITPVLKKMTLIGAQTAEDAVRFKKLHAPHVEVTPNLKLLSDPLQVNEVALQKLKTEIGTRPHWCAANTHPGEDEVILETHLELKTTTPNLLTILIPRHPERALKIRELMESRGLHVAQRSRDEKITPATDIYLADTLGEIRNFYALSSITFLGATLIPKGGHNPMEPAQLGTYVLHGPYTYSNPLLYQYLEKQGAAELIQNKDELVAALLKHELAERTAPLQKLQQDQADGFKKLKALLDPTLAMIRGRYVENP